MPSSSILCTRILDGWRISQRLRDKIFFKTNAIYNISGKHPGLAVIRVGETMEMERYVYAKRQLAYSLGINFYDYIYPKSITTNELRENIHKLNQSNDIHGIIVQLPLSKSLNSQSVLDAILPVKDVDGCCTINKNILSSTSDFHTLNTIHIPCAALAMLQFFKIS